MAADAPLNLDNDIPFDMQKGVDELRDSLGLGQEEDTPDTPDTQNEGEDTTEPPEGETPEGEKPEGEEETPEEGEDVTPVAKQPPKSWGKDKHELWAKLPPEAQEYIETREKQAFEGINSYKAAADYGNELKSVITPYEPVIKQSGLTDAQAMQYLMNAHVRLSYGTLEQRKAAYEELGRNIGVLEADPNAPAPDPEVIKLRDELGKVQQTLTVQQQKEMQQAQEKVRNEVNSFWEEMDENGQLKHPYMDDVAEEVAIFIKGGLSLSEAYERAIWANPVTRQKEQQRLQTEQKAAADKKAKEEAEKARRAKSSNVNSRDTKHSAPTGSDGKMFDDMENILHEIKQRDVH